MKTAEEHLEEHYRNFRKRIPYDDNVLKAMESFAKERAKAAYIEGGKYGDIQTFDEWYDEFIKK